MLTQRDSPALPQEAQCNHRGPSSKREAEMLESCLEEKVM